MTTLFSERIYFRPVEMTDVGEEYYFWMNDSEINQYMETRLQMQSIQAIKDYIDKVSYDPNQYFFAICLEDNDEHIGNIKLGPVNWIHRHADISLFIGRKDLWGQGYGTEAIHTIVSFAFGTLGLHKVCAGIYKANESSLNAFKKAGFEEEGTRKGHVFWDGKYIDLVLFGKFNINA